MQQDPSHSETVDFLLVLYAGQGRLTRAVEMLEGAMAAGDSRAVSRFELGKLRLQLGESGKALVAFEQAIARDSTLVAAYNNVGALHAQNGDVGRAIAALERALQLAPEYAQAHLNLGIAYAENGETSRAAAALERCLELDPSHAGALCKLGEIQADLGRFESAREYMEAARSADSTFAWVHYQLGTVLLELGEVEHGVGALARATELDPTFPEAYYRLGRAHMKTGNAALSRQALESFERWRKVGRDDPALWRGIENCRRGLAVEPRSPLVHYQLARVYAAEGWVEEAAREYHHTIACEPDHRPARVGLGMLLLRHRDWGGASAAFEQVVHRWPEDRNGWSSLCVAYTESERWGEGEEAFGRALALHPRDPALHANYGTYWLKREQPERALESYRRALSLDSGSRKLQRAVARLTDQALRATADDGSR